jgi:hypothetical protein
MVCRFSVFLIVARHRCIICRLGLGSRILEWLQHKMLQMMMLTIFEDDGTGTHYFQRKTLQQDVLSAMEIVTARLVFLHMDQRG